MTSFFHGLTLVSWAGGYFLNKASKASRAVFGTAARAAGAWDDEVSRSMLFFAKKKVH
jgi:hypothetical protein